MVLLLVMVYGTIGLNKKKASISKGKGG